MLRGGLSPDTPPPRQNAPRWLVWDRAARPGPHFRRALSERHIPGSLGRVPERNLSLQVAGQAVNT